MERVPDFGWFLFTLTYHIFGDVCVGIFGLCRVQVKDPQAVIIIMGPLMEE